MYSPTYEIEHTPPDFQLHDYEDIYISTIDNAKIHCWLIKHDNCKEVPTILYFPGQTGSILSFIP
jgi:dipeptidyl aminopeptidase/acylaminoacyl peptidase